MLNVKALNADFSVPVFVTQKLIKQNEVNPITSQPKNNITTLPDETSNNILITNDTKKSKNLSTNGSYLKYAKAYINTTNAIVVVKKIKLNEILSIKKWQFILKLSPKKTQSAIFMLYTVLFNKIDSKLKHSDSQKNNNENTFKKNIP